MTKEYSAEKPKPAARSRANADRDATDAPAGASRRAAAEKATGVATPRRAEGGAQAFARATAGSGSAVPHAAEMQRAFGEDFSGVRAHLGKTKEMRALGAQAAAQRETVAFAAPHPSSAVVAHELAHVVQHRRASVAGSGTGRSSAAPAEREAERAARTAAGGGKVQIKERPAAPIQLLGAEEQKAVGGELTKIEAELPGASTAPALYKLRTRVEALLEKNFEANETDQALLARAHALLATITSRWEALQPKKPVMAPTSSSSAPKKPSTNALAAVFAAAGGGSTGKPNFTIKKRDPSQPSAPSSAPKHVVDLSKPAEKPPTPAEKLEILNAHMTLPAHPSAVRDAEHMSAALAGTAALNDENLDALLPHRIRGSRTLERAFKESSEGEKMPEELGLWVAADREFRALARSKGANASGKEIFTVLHAANAKMTQNSSRGAPRSATAGGAFGPLLAHEMISTALPQYCEWLSAGLKAMKAGKISAIELASQAYQRLNSIHAFADANGRVCNMVMDFVLLCGNLLPASLSGELIAPLPSGERVPSEGTKRMPTVALETVMRGVMASHSATAKRSSAAHGSGTAASPSAHHEELAHAEADRKRAAFTAEIAAQERRAGDIENEIVAIVNLPPSQRPKDWVATMEALETKRHEVLAIITGLREQRARVEPK